MFDHKRSLIIFLFFLTLITSLSYANCPNPELVLRNCYGEQQCEGLKGWHTNYPGWIGVVIGHDNGELHMSHFLKADWFPLKGQENGETACSYAGDLGTEVRLTQGKWGNVPKPTQGIWVPSSSYAPGKEIPDLSCVNTQATNCPFNY